MEARTQHVSAWSLGRKLSLTAWFYILSILINLAVSSGFLVLYFRPAFRDSNRIFREQQNLEYVRGLVHQWRAQLANGSPDRLEAARQLLGAVALLDQISDLPSVGPIGDDLRSTAAELRIAMENQAPESADKLDTFASRLARAIDALSRARQESLARASRAQTWVTRLLIANSIVGAALCGVGLWFVRAWVVKPAAVLKQAASRIRAGDFNPRIEVASDDEMGRLGHEMSEMARQIGGLQEQFIDRERLQAADQMIEKVEANLREPLARILALAQATAARNDGKQELQACQERINGTVRHFEAWLGQLRAGLTCTVGQQRETEPAALFANVLAAVQPALDRHRVQLVTETDSALGPVRLDPLQFEQALISLVTNAIQASLPGQKVRLSAGRHHSSERWQIQVADQGSGIAPELMDKIFLPFFTTKPDGNGIGLGMVKSIVRQHGGELSVTSMPGQGSCFTIRLPA